MTLRIPCNISDCAVVGNHSHLKSQPHPPHLDAGTFVTTYKERERTLEWQPEIQESLGSKARDLARFM